MNWRIFSSFQCLIQFLQCFFKRSADLRGSQFEKHSSNSWWRYWYNACFCSRQTIPCQQLSLPSWKHVGWQGQALVDRRSIEKALLMYFTHQIIIEILTKLIVLLLSTIHISDPTVLVRTLPPHTEGFVILLRHTVGLLWTSDQPVAKTSTDKGKHNTETQKTMPGAGLEPTTLVSKRPRPTALPPGPAPVTR
jgi:hypothetical protein